MSKKARGKSRLLLKLKWLWRPFKNQQTLAELGKKFDVSPIVISKGKSDSYALI